MKFLFVIVILFAGVGCVTRSHLVRQTDLYYMKGRLQGLSEGISVMNKREFEYLKLFDKMKIGVFEILDSIKCEESDVRNFLDEYDSIGK